MSHFSVYVFTNEDSDRDVESLLAPYNEEIIVAPYIKYTKQQAIQKVREDIEKYKNGIYKEFLNDPESYKKECNNKDHIKYLEEGFPKKLNWSDEECFEDLKQYYDEDEVDNEGNLWSTYNPNSKWDWYDDEGGRWKDCLVTKEGKNTNGDYVSEIDWDKTPVPFAFVDSYGRWYERGEMGWWGIVTNEKDKDEYADSFKRFVKSLPEKINVTVVDCHI
jgi:hypothetical protein